MNDGACANWYKRYTFICAKEERKENPMPVKSPIHAPFTPEQVTQLNRYQSLHIMHPFTCVNDSNHSLLVAKEDGWHCPDCGYTQDWAHGFMAHEGFLDTVSELEAERKGGKE